MTTPRMLRRARAAVTVLFLLYGVILGTWTSRIPAVKHRLGLSDSELSVGLLAFAAGAIVGMQVSGRLVDRFGSRTVMVPAVLLDALLLVTPSLAGSRALSGAGSAGVAGNLAVLAGCLVAFGAVHGTLNVAMNVNAVEVQAAYGRPIISSCHAVYSVGGFLGAGIGGLFAGAGLGAGTTFAGVAAAVLVVAAVDRFAVLPRTAVAGPPVDSAADGPTARVGLPAHGVLLLGVLVFCCLVGEGAAADWSTVYLRDNLGAAEGVATLGYAAFSVMMVAGRLVGDRLSARFGPVALVRGCGVLAAAGLAAGLLVDAPAGGIIGFGCLGAGLSCIAPQVFSAAGSRDPAVAGQAIARVAGIGFLGFVVGPVVIGLGARLVGLPHALLIPAVLALFVALCATAIRAAPRAEPAPAVG